MIKVTAEVSGAEAIRTAFATAKTDILSRWYATVRRHAFRAVALIQTRYRSAGATTPTATRVGTGALRASYSQVTSRESDGVESTIGLLRLGARGHALRYGAVHEEGATIRPVRAKFLAIPLPTIRSPSGIAPPPRSFPNTFILSRGDRAVIMQRLGKTGVRPLFALRHQVYVPPRPQGGAINAAIREIRPQLEAELEQNAVDVLAGSRGAA